METQLNKAIDAVCIDWDISGGFIVNNGEEVLHQNIYGYADRHHGVPTQQDSRYIQSTESPFFVGLGILMLMDQGKVKLSDKLSLYIPEYTHSGKITLKHLIKSQSGIPDFFHNKLMIELNRDEKHEGLDHQEKMRIETQAYNQNRGFNKVIKLIEGMPLEYEPGTPYLSGSESNTSFLAEVIRRVTGMSLFEFFFESIFSHLEMKGVKEGTEVDTVSYGVYQHNKLVRLPLEYEVEGLFTVTLDDMVKLTKALGAKQLLSQKTWKLAQKYDEDGNGLVFENANGFSCGDSSFMGYGYFVYFNHETGISFASLVNEEQTFRMSLGTWHYFRRASRQVIDALFTYPKNTKMVKLSKHEFWNALDISVETSQAEFVLDAKSSVAMALMYKTKKAFVQMEGHRVVGLLVLDIDKKKNHYNIDIVQIDKRFQNRGYGKIMLQWAVDYLKESGAKELEIGVNRFNPAAIKIYKAVGFTEKSIYEEGMTLHLLLNS